MAGSDIQVKISVIVPIYNVSLYLKECIKSICEQTFPDIEILLVNDGSTDECGSICEEYAKKDPRITIIQKKNEGLSKARNSGIERAKGKYIYFLDGDDYIEKNLLEICYREMEAHNLDCVSFNYQKVSEEGELLEESHFLEHQKELRNTSERFYYITHTMAKYEIGWEVWSKLFRTSIIKQNKIWFTDNKVIFSEDLDFSYRYMMYCKKVKCIKNSLYFYLIRGTSIMHRVYKARIKEYLVLNKRLYEFTLSLEGGEAIKKDFYLFYSIFMYKQYRKMKTYDTLLKEQICCAPFFYRMQRDILTHPVSLLLLYRRMGIKIYWEHLKVCRYLRGEKT